MLIQLKGGRIIDPVHDRDEIGDLFIENGRIVTKPDDRTPDESYDVSGKIVMAGAIDLHSHIAGTNVTLGRQLMPELPTLAAEEGQPMVMFAAADLVFKSGALVVCNGKVVRVTWGRCYHVEPGFDAQIKRRLSAFYDRYYGADPSWFRVSNAITHRPDRFATVPCLN